MSADLYQPQPRNVKISLTEDEFSWLCYALGAATGRAIEAKAEKTTERLVQLFNAVQANVEREPLAK